MFCPETNYLQRYQFFGTVFLAQISDKLKKKSKFHLSIPTVQYIRKRNQGCSLQNIQPLDLYIYFYPKILEKIFA
jgi:hypothetical protein